ncbi:MAG: hypothetical protein ACTSUE_04600 [Promethearchaeota archaeon]
MVSIVALDSNFAFVPIQFKIDIFHEIPLLMEEKTQIILFSGIFDELLLLEGRDAGRRGTPNIFAALKLIRMKLEEKKVLLVEHEKREGELVDDYLVRSSKALQEGNGLLPSFKPGIVVIATNDKELKRKARAAGIKVIQVRNKKHLSIS